jgi:predicted RNA-binding Zn-ribbon protein involved in translation (DUF1610 family)
MTRRERVERARPQQRVCVSCHVSLEQMVMQEVWGCPVCGDMYSEKAIRQRLEWAHCAGKDER